MTIPSFFGDIWFTFYRIEVHVSARIIQRIKSTNNAVAAKTVQFHYASTMIDISIIGKRSPIDLIVGKRSNLKVGRSIRLEIKKIFVRRNHIGIFLNTVSVRKANGTCRGILRRREIVKN
ncbi:Uncharacterised protein [Burkholderia pseudomallei]|nr:Uncharacterised protein [Burkholderia pseudomallei]